MQDQMIDDLNKLSKQCTKEYKVFWRQYHKFQLWSGIFSISQILLASLTTMGSISSVIDTGSGPNNISVLVATSISGIMVTITTGILKYFDWGERANTSKTVATIMSIIIRKIRLTKVLFESEQIDRKVFKILTEEIYDQFGHLMLHDVEIPTELINSITDRSSFDEIIPV